ncbi:MAG: hypothetical protein ACE37M_03540 [Henriciella sp.]
MDEVQSQRALALIVNWQRNVRANTAVLFAVMVVPIFIVMAFAIDSARQANAARHVQFALDTASLAGVLALKDASLSDDDVEKIAIKAFVANLDTAQGDLTCPRQRVQINREDVSVKVSADCQFDAMIGGSITTETVYVRNAAKAKANLRNLDLALMLDVSGSMHGTKLDYLKTAAKDMANTMLNLSADDRVRIALVSFSTSVNAGEYGNIVQGLPVLDDEDDDGLDKVCVSERAGAEAYSDRSPAPFRWIGNKAERCPRSSVVPLTDSVTTLTRAIDRMYAAGSTAGHIAVAWSWYLVSPEWSGIWPASSRPLEYSDPDGLKAVVLMSDGSFNTQYEQFALGRSKIQATKLCYQMRAKGIVVFSVAFQAPPPAQVTLKNCAKEEGRYFEANSGEELLKAYAAIASQLSVLSLSE